MSNIYSGSATGALNEKEYINKIYDKIGNSQKDTLKENYDASVKQLDTGAQTVNGQTADYMKRAYVENGRAANNYQASPASTGSSRLGSNAQAALTLGNQNKANITALNQQQAAANQEFERQRKLLADRYSAAIKQAQADNDMNRAQDLYNAAKAEEEQLRALRLSAATLMAGKGDNSIMSAIGNGAAVTPDTSTPTWSGVTKYEDSINEIFDKKMESQQLESDTAYKENASDLEAKQAEAQRSTDQNLTKVYVDALKKDKNYREVQTAYGQGSGTAAQAQLAREAGLTGDLTNLRKLQLKQDSDVEQKRIELLKYYGNEIAKAQAANDLKRVQELYEAAEKQEQALTEEQKTVGKYLANQKDYSVLGKLYGLTSDQINRLQGTGAYAPVYSGGGGGSGSGGGGGPQDAGEPDRSDYRVVNMSNSAGVRIDGGGMSWAKLAAAVQEGTVKEIFDDENKTVHYVRVRQEDTNSSQTKPVGNGSTAKLGGNIGNMYHSIR